MLGGQTPTQTAPPADSRDHVCLSAAVTSGRALGPPGTYDGTTLGHVALELGTSRRHQLGDLTRLLWTTQLPINVGQLACDAGFKRLGPMAHVHLRARYGIAVSSISSGSRSKTKTSTDETTWPWGRLSEPARLVSSRRSRPEVRR